MIWGPLAVTATRNLPPRLAGAGSGVYNETRQVAGVLGSAGIATLMGGLIADQIAQTMQRMRPSGAGGSAMNAPAVGGEGVSGGQVPDFLREPIATAMNDSLMLALVLAVVGMVACLFFAKPVDRVRGHPGRMPLSHKRKLTRHGTAHTLPVPILMRR